MIEEDSTQERELYCPLLKVFNLLPVLLPPEARKHCRASKKEMLLAIRSVLDSAIEFLEKEPPKKKVTKIPVK